MQSEPCAKERTPTQSVDPHLAIPNVDTGMFRVRVSSILERQVRETWIDSIEVFSGHT